MRMPSSADGGVRGRAGADVPNAKAGFDVSDGAGPGVPNENPLVLAAGLVSDWTAGESNKNPLGAPAGVVEPNAKPPDAAPDFSTGAVGGVAEEAPNVNRLFAGVAGGAEEGVPDSLVDWLKEKGALGGLEASVTGAVAGKDAEVKAGLETERAGFRSCSASAGVGVFAWGKEKTGVVTSVDWVSGFVLGTGAGDEVPNPLNEAIEPLKRGFCGAGLASFFSPSCDVEEGVRLNGSELLLIDCVDEVDID